MSEVDASGVAAPADWAALNSPETYLGSLRGERRGRTGLLARNQWALSGDWTVAEEFSALDAAGGSIAYRFEGRDVNLVLGADAPVGFTVTVDGEPPGAAAGVDVDGAGAGVLAEPRMYQLVRAPGPVRERTVEVTFDGPACGPTSSRSGERTGSSTCLTLTQDLRPVRFGVSYNKHGRPIVRPCEGERELRRRLAGLALLGLAFALPEAASAKAKAHGRGTAEGARGHEHARTR